MATYTATIVWTRQPSAAFTDNKYSRAHEWRFDGGTVVPASSSPKVVPVPLSRQDAVDPEESFVASLSSCHMLFFLFFAAKAGFVVDRYEDQAVGDVGKNADGAMAVLTVRLRPKADWSGASQPGTRSIGSTTRRTRPATSPTRSVPRSSSSPADERD